MDSAQQEPFNWVEAIKGQFTEALNAENLNLVWATNYSSNNHFGYGGTPSTNIRITAWYSMASFLKVGLSPDAIFSACNSGFISEWIKDCGGVTNMSVMGELATTSSYTIQLELVVGNMEKFIENVKVQSWQSYSSIFSQQLEEELVKK